MEQIKICRAFCGEIAEPPVRYGCGHINETYVFRDANGRRFILQKINTDVFRDPDGLMENIVRVTAFLRAKIAARGGNPDRETLTVVPTHDGAPYLRDPNGGCWRVYPFIEDTISYQTVDQPEVFEAAAEAFGQFQRDLADFPAAQLHETIPHFHDTPDRYRQLADAASRDPMGRLQTAAPEWAFAQARGAGCGTIVNAIAAGTVPLRVTHNDTKLNNILMDAHTGAAVCIIDLDTIMPGSALYDFGDSIRFGASTAAEDEPDLGRVHFDLALFAAYARGFLRKVGDCLTAEEIALLPESARLMTLECGMRFLADYLNGDTYFHTAYPTHNLVRARTQFRLVAEMEEQAGKMAETVAAICAAR